MNLRINAKDHNLVEDDFGSPIFKFLGLHPCDKDEIIKVVNTGGDTEDLREEINSLRNDIADLEDELNAAQSKLEDIQSIL